MAKVKIKRQERDMGFALALAHKGQVRGDVALTLVFHQEDKRHRDLDNMLSACKQILDGVALGLGINDKQFRPITIDRGEPDKLNPRVELMMEFL